MTGLGPGAFQ